ncbi:MAG: EamA family transporter [Opitutales bacterium]|nr:EamA family transporter [Opitutales bacterium]
MIPALFTVLFFSLGAIFSGRSARYVGVHRTNCFRLCLACCFLGIWVYFFGSGLHHPATVWFLLSGVVGYGIGDTGYFMALPRIGAQQTSLITLCLSAVIAAIVEYLWLGTVLLPVQLISGVIIISGVVIVLTSRRRDVPYIQGRFGYFWGCVSALGQGGGVVLARKGFLVAESLGQPLDVGTAAFDRLLGGSVFAVIIFLVLRSIYGKEKTFVEASPQKKIVYVLLVALLGPVFGVSCFQWALFSAPGGIVMAVVSMTPVAIIPFAYLIEGEKPGMRSLWGALVAVFGTILLALVS